MENKHKVIPYKTTRNMIYMHDPHTDTATVSDSATDTDNGFLINVRFCL